jgi:hypothetical protein
MLNGHFDYGNGFHGPVYLNPHRIFRRPSLIWRLAQDLIEVLPDPIVGSTDVVAGPVMGGALLAHTIAGLMDGRRALTHPPTSFAPLSLDAGRSLRRYRTDVEERCCWPTCATRKTLARAKPPRNGRQWWHRRHLRSARGGVDTGVPNCAGQYQAPKLPWTAGRSAGHAVTTDGAGAKDLRASAGGWRPGA